MKGLLLALRLSASDSLRGIKKFTDVFSAFSNGFPPPGLAVAGQSLPALPFPTFTNPESAPDKKSEGFLWGVPKRRRSAERRLTLKFGLKNWHWKMLVPRTNLLICDTCGHHYQAKHLCLNCYEKVNEETKAIRQNVEAQFGDGAVDKDVIVLYDSDKEKGLNIDSARFNASNKLIVEIPKERPAFFSSNLLQKTTIGLNRKAKDVTTTDPVPIVHKTQSN